MSVRHCRLALFLAASFTSSLLAQPVRVFVQQPISFAEAAAQPTFDTIIRPPIPTLAGTRVPIQFRSSSSIDIYPADSAGAVSPDYVVGAFNTGIIAHDRNGNVLARATLNEFWSEAPPQLVFDPRAVYDPVADRWMLMSITGGKVLLATSQTGNPAGVWNRYSIAMESDYSGLVLTRNYIVATTDRFFPGPNPQRTTFMLMPRATIFSTPPGSPLTMTMTDVPESAVPVAADNSTSKVYGAAGENRLNVYEITPERATRVAELTLPREYAEPRAAPQAGSGNEDLDPGPPVVADACIRNGILYAVQSVGLGGGTTLRKALQSWTWKLGEPVAGNEGRIKDDPAAQLWYSYPATTVNRNGEQLIAFTLFSRNGYPSFAYIVRDPAGNDSTTMILHEGEERYLRTRWGDYNTVGVDPRNDIDFWAVGTSSEPASQWSGWWSSIEVVSPASPRRRATRH